ncbi:MAG TPA: EAL domain-containing protein [Alphaproteobacteria bacterium]|nr:EAL domain-containing protein [Alphaproteobacteria bacterium]
MAALADRGLDLRGERDRFVAFSFAAADLLLEVGADGLIRFASGAARAMTGRDNPELLGEPYLSIFAKGDRRYVSLLIDRLKGGHRLEPVMVRLAVPDADLAPAVLGGCRLPDQESVFHLTLSLPCHPALSDRIANLRDGATGLLEKDAFEQAATQAMTQSDGRGNVRLTLLRLARLQELRARAGEAATNAFLGNVGALLRTLSLGNDTAGQLAEGRYGFVHAGNANIATVWDQLHALSREADPAGQGVHVDYSTIDLALDGMSEGDAARALHYAIGKFATAEEGGFSIASLTEAFGFLLRDTVAHISTLKGAFAEQRFDVALQPIVNLATRTPHHYELLVRFEGDRSPFEMVTFAEDVGLIEEIDLAICQRALDLLRETAPNSTPIAVNLSGRSLESTLFTQALFALLKPHAPLRNRLYFEITESMRITKLEQVDNVVQALRAEGHRFALDDFGAGASSFPYLNALTVDFVKIDGTYVRRMLSSPRDAAILKSIVALCRDLSVRTIAEMVESEEQAKMLRELGVDLGQGFMFGRPAPLPAELKRRVAVNVARPILRPGAKQSWG